MAGSLRAQIVGHERPMAQLWQAVQNQHLPSTLLFIGPEGVGKSTIALALAQRLVCENPLDNDACGLCGSCLRMQKKSSESLLWIAPEKNTIKLEQAQLALEFCSFAVMGKARVIVIDQAEALNPQAANSLLKVLEEPPPETYFILIAPSSRHLLATLRSRSQILSFGRVELSAMKKKTGAADWLLQASQGSFSKLAALQEIGQQEQREHAAEFLSMWLQEQQNPQEALYLSARWREMVRDRNSGLQLAKNLLWFLRDAIILQVHGPDSQLLNPDKKALLIQLATIKREALLKMGGMALNLEKDLLAHRDLVLLFEEFWLRTQGRLLGTF